MVNRITRRGTRAAVAARHENLVGPALGDAGRNRAHASFGDEFHRHARPRVRVLHVENDFGQILDGVDVMVRRRRYEPHARRAAPRAGNPRPHLGTRQMTAFAGFRTLGHLDLNLIGAHEIAARHAETTRSDLLDGRPLAVAVRQRNLAGRIFTALAAVRPAMETVHGDGQTFMGFLRDRAVAHRACVEPLDDLAGRFNL